MEHKPPQILRIKRKRGQDPLQALILEDNNAAKRSKPSSPVSSTVLDKNNNFYFTLTRTDESGAINEEAVIESILSEAPSLKRTGSSILDKGAEKKVENHNVDRKRKFIIPKRQTEEDTYISNELADMVSSLLTKHNVNSPQRKRRNRSGNSASNLGDMPIVPETGTERQPDVVAAEEVSDYVYDVYQLSLTEPMTTANHPQSQIGYIRFFDEDNDLYQSDEEKDKTNNMFSDDEDSNAESFYQNDYPSDEDAGAYSDTYTEEDIEIIQLQDGQDSQDNEEYEYISSGTKPEEGFEDLYDDFYDDGDNDINFLAEDQYHNVDNDQELERNHFFDNEEEDDLAIHRDIIFGKLKKMIDESN